MPTPTPIRHGNKFVLVGLENSYGVNANPANTDAVRGLNLVRSPYEGVRVERTYDRASMGSYTQINAGPHSTVSFDVQVCLPANGGDAPPYANCLRGCGLKETQYAAEAAPNAWAIGTDYVIGDKVEKGGSYYICVQANTAAAANAPDIGGGDAYWDAYELLPARVDYQPRDKDFESITLKYYWGDNLQLFRGARGTMKLMTDAQGIPILHFDFTSLYDKPVAENAPDPDISDYRAPRPVTKDNTPEFHFFGNEDQPLKKLEVTQGNEVNFEDLVNWKEVIVSDRKVTFAMQSLGVNVNEFDYFSKMETHLGNTNDGPLLLTHGPAAGRQLIVSTDSAQIESFGESNMDNLLMYDVGGRFTPERNSELLLRFT